MDAGAGGEGGELVSAAFVKDEIEGEMLKGLLESGGIPSMVKAIGLDGRVIGSGLLFPNGGRARLLVRAQDLGRARRLLDETLVEDEEALPEPANARHLEEAEGGRKPRAYGLIGAYARIYLVSFGVIVAIFLAFLLTR
jgi:Putative prokaryotic signal transducing protein